MRSIFLAPLVACSSLLGAAQPPGTDSSVATVVWKAVQGTDFTGDIRQVMLDTATRDAYLATRTTLYRVKGDKVDTVAKQPDKTAELILAPGGAILAWLLPQPQARGLLQARVLDLTGREVGLLRLQESPHGFGALYLGFQERLVVTASPLDDRDGMNGRFQYTFWSSDGKERSKVVFPEQQDVVLDRLGQAVLFLAPGFLAPDGAKAVAHDPSGTRLWELPGSFRRAVLAAEGRLALLNPAPPGDIRDVWIFRGSGRATVVKAPTPVQHLRVAPDLASALVVGNDGTYSYLDPARGVLTEAHALLPGTSFRITDADFVGPDKVAFGVRQNTGTPDHPRWSQAALVAVDRGGKVIFREELKSGEGSGSYPRIEVEAGGAAFIGYTAEHAVLVSFGQ